MRSSPSPTALFSCRDVATVLVRQGMAAAAEMTRSAAGNVALNQVGRSRLHAEHRRHHPVAASAPDWPSTKDRRRLEEENAKLKKLVAQFVMEIDTLKVCLRKRW